MPEERNRVITDHLSDLLFTTCNDANENLKNEGILRKKIFFVGNIMIDTLRGLKNNIERSKILEKLKLEEKGYVVLTLHRPSNVDNKVVLKRLIEAVLSVGRYIPVIFPVHPRTRENLKNLGIKTKDKYLKLIKPLGYLDFLKLCKNARFIMTDSGGIQEESTILGIPCLTLRKNTERPITVIEGTNILAGIDQKSIFRESSKIIRGEYKFGSIPRYWDGRTAERIINILKKSKISPI